MPKRRKAKTLLRYFQRGSRDPESMARGMSLGLFIGFLPSFGGQILIAFFLASFLGVNRIAAAAGTLVTNPITTLPLSAVAFWLGDLVIPGSRLAGFDAADFEWRSLLAGGYAFYAYLLGCAIMAVVGGAAGYVGTKAYLHCRRGLLSRPTGARR